MRQFAFRVRRAIKRFIHGPRVAVHPLENSLTLGSVYGGWTFLDRPSLYEGVVLSCGLGEDASFDVELISNFQARITVVDPTPRAIEHFTALTARFGQPAQATYSEGGSQPVDAYNLTSVSEFNLQLVPRALTGNSGTVRFYAPSDPSAVSYSVINFQNRYSTSTSYIEVPAISFEDLSRNVDLADLALAKFDIEGAEIDVIPHMLDAGFRPEQLLVEYDELNWPSRRARANFDRVHQQLLAHGYIVFHFDRRSCVSYWYPSGH